MYAFMYFLLLFIIWHKFNCQICFSGCFKILSFRVTMMSPAIILLYSLNFYNFWHFASCQYLIGEILRMFPPSFTYTYLSFWKYLCLIGMQSLLSLGDGFCMYACVKWLFHLKPPMQTYMHLISVVPEHKFSLVKHSWEKDANGSKKYMLSVFHEASEIFKKSGLLTSHRNKKANPNKYYQLLWS